MKKDQIKYVAVAPNGKQFTRTSRREYAFCVLAGNGDALFVWQWTSTMKLAERAASAARYENEFSGYAHQHTKQEMKNAKKKFSNVLIVPAEKIGGNK